MTQKQCFLYRITNKVNGKMYIGMTVDPKQRWRQHKCHSNRGGSQVLAASMRKHGKENFAFEVLMTEFGADCIEKCRDAEVLLIALSDTRSPNGYNLTDGGEGVFGYEYSEEQNKANSERQKKLWTQERRDKASETTRKFFDENPEHGKVIWGSRRKSGKYDAAVVAASKVTAKYFEEPSRRLAAKARSVEFWVSSREKALGVKGQKVKCVQTGAVFDAACSAARWVAATRGNASYGGIIKACSGECHLAYGLQWVFAKDAGLRDVDIAWSDTKKLTRLDIKPLKPKPEKAPLTSERRSELLREAYAAGKMDNRNLRMKAVMCVETGTIYKSCRDALKSLGKADKRGASTIGAVANGNRKSAYGHTWKFIEKEMA